MKDKKSKRMIKTENIHKKRMSYGNYSGDSKYITLETPKVKSSCRCCSNPRKSEKGMNRLTLQERKHIDIENE